MADELPKAIQPEAVPGVAVAEAGTVLLDGPGGVALAMTPEAAAETGRRLIAAATEAQGWSQQN